MMLLAVLAVLSTHQADAQLGRGLMDKAKRKAEEKAKDAVNNPGSSSSSSSSSSKGGSVSDDMKAIRAKEAANADGSYEDFVRSKASAAGWLFTNNEYGRFTNENMYTGGERKYAEELSYPETLKKIKATGRKNASEYDYNLLMNYQAEYEKGFSAYFKSGINKWIEEAYKEKSSNKKNALEKLARAKEAISIVLLTIPDYAPAKELEDDIKKAEEAIGGSYLKGLYISDVHKKNAGKVMFSKTPIIPGKETEAQFTNSFSASDEIYGIVYLKAGIKDLVGDDDEDIMFYYFIHVDGVANHRQAEFKIPKAELTKNKAYVLINVKPDPNKATELDVVEWGDRLAELSPRKHDIEVSVGEWANGTLKIDLTGADVAKIKANAEVAKQKVDVNKAQQVSLEEYYKAPVKTYKDPALSIANLSKLYKASSGEAASVVKVFSIDGVGLGDYDINKNFNTGLPDNKMPTGRIFVVYKDKSGNCFLDQPTYLRDYSGGGTYGELRVLVGRNPTRVACDKVK